MHHFQVAEQPGAQLLRLMAKPFRHAFGMQESTWLRRRKTAQKSH